MHTKPFMNLAKNRFETCMSVLERKNVEYSRGEDKLHNFKRAGIILGSGGKCHTPEDALVDMFVKHLVSVLDMVDDLPDLPRIKLFYEKITDAINYLVLLEALFVERTDEPEQEATSDEDSDRILDEVEKSNTDRRNPIDEYLEERRLKSSRRDRVSP